MAKTQSKIITETVKPLYAVAGATEVAYEFARGYTIEAQKTAVERFNDVQKSVSKIEREPKALQNQALSAVNARVAELQKDAKDAQAKFEARVTELQKAAARAAQEGPERDRRHRHRARQDLRRPRRPWREDRRRHPQGRRQGRHHAAQGPVEVLRGSPREGQDRC